MKLAQEILPSGVLKVSLEGDLDIMGASQADLPFKGFAEQHSKLIVDLSGVGFLASIGIRVLVKTAKSIAENGGRMAVYGAQHAPDNVLKATGVDRIIALCGTEADALAQVDR